MNQSPAKSTIDCCAVIVTYHPPDDLVDSVRKMSRLVSHLVVVDNGSGEPYDRLLTEIAEIETVHLIRFGRNKGIAAGFNAGVTYALLKGVPLVATFDQDSRVNDDYFTALLKLIHADHGQSSVALVAPRLLDPVTGLTGTHAKDAKDYGKASFHELTVTISSGCLIKSDVFERVGLYDEELFMDYVDHEHCLRLKKSGYTLLEAADVQLEHRIGATTRHQLLGWQVKVTNHSPVRRYYMTRNRLLLYGRYGFSFPSWALNDCFCMLKELAGILLFEANKGRKFRMMLLAVCHAFIGRRGALYSETSPAGGE